MQTDFWTLIDCARRPTVRVWAQSSPFELKDALHHALEKEIAEALKHNSTDDLKIVELKRQKLQLKDEIERLRNAQ